jgi:hypothetical protein
MRLSTKVSLTSMLLAVALTSASSANAVTIAQWTFESIPSTYSSTSATAGSFSPEVGLGSATASHSSSATTYTSPVGNGSLRSLSSNNWAFGDYYQFQVSTVDFNSINVSFDRTGSSTGPRDFRFAYSTNGTTFSNFSQYGVSATTWTSGSSISASTLSFNFSQFSLLNNQATVFFRLIANSATAINGTAVGSAGTSRVDNFTVTGTAVPEPSSFLGLLGIGAIGGIAQFARNRRKVQA